MVLRGRFYLVPEQVWVPGIDLMGFVKFPTASSSNGLGTGEFDEGIAAELTNYLSDHLIGFVDVGYTVIGSPSGTSLDNQ